jgi:hypothetical protein
MIRAAHLAIGSAALTAITMPASAYVNTMYSVGFDPSVFGAPIASLNITSTAWDFPLDASEVLQGKKDSGFKAEILDGSGFPLVPDPFVNPNKTSLQTDVYSVTAPTVIPDGSGDLNLLPGDLVFAYRLRLTGNNANTVETLQEFGVNGFGPDLGGFGAFDSSVMLGRGYTVSGLGAATTEFPLADPSDFEEGDLFGPGSEFSSLEWNWQFGNQAAQMGNAEQITLLIFARGAVVTEGFAKFAGASGQAGTTTSTVANNAPVLIPTIPAPAGTTLLVGAGLMAARRRR